MRTRFKSCARPTSHIFESFVRGSSCRWRRRFFNYSIFHGPLETICICIFNSVFVFVFGVFVFVFGVFVFVIFENFVWFWRRRFLNYSISHGPPERPFELDSVENGTRAPIPPHTYKYGRPDTYKYKYKYPHIIQIQETNKYN